MSEPHDGAAAPETGNPDEGDGDDAEDQSQSGGAEEGEGEAEEGEEPARKPADDWEKKAHNQAGRAARERSRRVAAERKAADLEDRLGRLERGVGVGGPSEDELMALIGTLPDTEDDPIGDIAAVKRALKLFRQRQVADEQTSTQQQQITRQIEGLRSAMIEAEADFMADNPDYQEAAKFYREGRREELVDAGYTGQYLERKLADDLFGVVRMSIEAGLDPAERVYQIAKKRGFKSGMKAADAKLDATRRAAESGIRPQARGAAGVLSWGDVAKLDGAARDKAWAKLREREKRGKAQ